MSMTDTIGRIAQIHAALASFSPTRTAASSTVTTGRSSTTGTSAAAGATTGSTAGSTTSSTEFADALTQAIDSGAATTAVGSGEAVTATAPVTGAGGATGADVVAAAKKYVGVPYVWGGTDPAVGMDCSGFVQRVFKDVGVDLPRLVRDQMTHGTPVASLKDAKPGDLLISFGGDHIAIYVGDGKAIDAPVPGKTIQVRDAWEKYSNLTAIRRIVPETTAAAVAAAPIATTTGSGATGATVSLASAGRVTGATAPVRVGQTSVPLSASQKEYAQQIVNRVKQRGLPQRAAEIALATAMQESNLRMYWNPKVPGSQNLTPDTSARGVDGYSVGLFQQQVNGSMFSWGTVNDAMNPVKSTDMFLDRLMTVPGWQNLPLTSAAQRVQVSAFPDAYAKWEVQARQLARDLGAVSGS